jgi:hypothetical protein
MVEQIIGWKTEYGSVFADKESAIEAERSETLLAFSQDLRDGLSMPMTLWVEKDGAAWAKIVFDNAMLINHLLDKYKLV